jgi:pSer/pThr/pTyr-binding forkhead associated (FHA) protein
MGSLDRVADGVPPPCSDPRGGRSRDSRDLGSKNGTFVGGERISSPTSLKDGDVIRLGRVSVTLHAVRPDQSTLSSAD